jgi:hypothetical protein
MPRLILVLAALTAATVLAMFGLAACSNDTTAPADPQPPALVLECHELGYPCSLADTPDELLEAAVALLDAALEQREQGSMDDVRAWLEAQPDVIEVIGDQHALRFRIEGCPPVWLLDVSESAKAAAMTDRPAPAPAPAVRTFKFLGDKSVIGEDTNSDGLVDNHDQKRALVLAPYFWQFQPHDESDLLQGQLQSLRGYAGNVVFKRNPTADAQNLTLADYLYWNEFDLIHLSTHGQRIVHGNPPQTEIVIATGVHWDFSNRRDVAYGGVLLLGAYDFDDQQSNRVIELCLTHEFFLANYHGGLSDAMVVLSACETGDAGANLLAESMAGDRFVMFGWTESVFSSSGFAASSLLMEQLGEGLTTSAALQAVDAAGLRTVMNPDGILTSFTRFAPGGGDLRLYELPQLLDLDGQVLQDGADLSHLVIGAVADGASDRLLLISEVDGVREADRDQFTIRYRLAGNDLPGTYDLATATQTGSFRYRVGHEVDLGFDLPAAATVPLEAVVDLPEGGQSRFRVDVAFTVPGSAGQTECAPYQPTSPEGGLISYWSAPGTEESYSFTVPESDRGGGIVTATLTSDHPDIIAWIIVQAAGDDVGAIVDNIGGPATVSFEGRAGQTYFIRCAQFGNATEEAYGPDSTTFVSTASFQSKVDCWEPNDVRSDAKRIALDDPVTAYMLAGYTWNSLPAAEYSDWYRVALPTAGTLTVDVSAALDGHLLRVRIENAAGSQVTAPGNPSQSGVPFSVTSSNVLSAGMYYVRLFVLVPGGSNIEGDEEPPPHWNDQYTFTAILNP